MLRFENLRAVLFAFHLTKNGLFSNLINERGFVKLSIGIVFVIYIVLHYVLGLFSLQRSKMFPHFFLWRPLHLLQLLCVVMEHSEVGVKASRLNEVSSIFSFILR